jgi:hypothetical protein
VKVGDRYNIITGCTILDNGKIIFSEYNKVVYADHVTLNDSNGHFIHTLRELNRHQGSFSDITNIDTSTIGVSICSSISIVNINTHKIVQTVNADYDCYGITHCDGKLYYCSNSEGIRRFDLKTKTNQLLVPTGIGAFSYITCEGNKLFYTFNTGTVTCCNMKGTEIWRFKDTTLLRSPWGVVVDNHGFVFVAGEQSGNIVVISPDGNSSKEVYQIASPRAMCYDKNENTILVCSTDNKASWFQISVDV